LVALLAAACAVIAVLPQDGLALQHRRAILVGLGVAAGALALGLPPPTSLVAGALAGVGLQAVARARVDAHSRRLRVALPGVCEGLAAALRAGLPLVEALVAISPGQPAAVSAALRESAALLRLGRALDEALAPIDSVFGPSALLLRETVRAFHRRGGGVAQALDRAATLAREEAELQDEVSSLTAQGRASALVLALLAPCGLVFFVVANPAGARQFISDPRGEILLTTALLLEGIGALWLWRLVRR
jgi:tight adherence protein B